VFFDLFDTLLHFDYSLMSEVSFKGKRIRTTTVAIFEKLGHDFKVAFSYEHLLEKALESHREITQLREREHREFPSLRRFQILAGKLGLEPSAAPVMVEEHMRQLYEIIYFPQEKKRVLDEIHEIPMVVASNFDHAVTARRSLEKTGLLNFLAQAHFSDELGWRKPAPQFFQMLEAKTGFAPERCLFVGDDPVADVVGASQAGFQVAWLNEKDTELTVAQQPSWTIEKLSDLLGILK
jgi:HAD superfamily hydrolase (TIGR01549 family)